MIDMGSGLVMPFYRLYAYYDFGGNVFPDFMYSLLYKKGRGHGNGGGKSLRYTAESGFEGFGAFGNAVSYGSLGSKYNEKISGLPYYSYFSDYPSALQAELLAYINGGQKSVFENAPTFILRNTSDNIAVRPIKNYSFEMPQAGFSSGYLFENQSLGYEKQKELSENFTMHTAENHLADGSQINLLSGFGEAEKYYVSQQEKIAESITAKPTPKSSFFESLQTGAAKGFDGSAEDFYRQEKLSEIVSEKISNVFSAKFTDMVSENFKNAVSEKFTGTFSGKISEQVSNSIIKHMPANYISKTPQTDYPSIFTQLNKVPAFSVIGSNVGADFSGFPVADRLRNKSRTAKTESVFDFYGSLGYDSGNYGSFDFYTSYFAKDGSKISVLPFLKDYGRIDGKEVVKNEQKTFPQNREEYGKDTVRYALCNGGETDFDSLIDRLAAALGEAAENSCERVHF